MGALWQRSPRGKVLTLEEMSKVVSYYNKSRLCKRSGEEDIKETNSFVDKESVYRENTCTQFFFQLPSCQIITCFCCIFHSGTHRTLEQRIREPEKTIAV